MFTTFLFLQNFRCHNKGQDQKKLQRFLDHEPSETCSILYQCLNSTINPFQYLFQFSSFLFWLPRHLLRKQVNSACMSNEPSEFPEAKKKLLEAVVQRNTGGTGRAEQIIKRRESPTDLLILPWCVSVANISAIQNLRCKFVFIIIKKTWCHSCYIYHSYFHSFFLYCKYHKIILFSDFVIFIDCCHWDFYTYLVLKSSESSSLEKYDASCYYLVMDLAELGLWFNLIILRVFFKLNGSKIL